MLLFLTQGNYLLSCLSFFLRPRGITKLGFDTSQASRTKFETRILGLCVSFLAEKKTLLFHTQHMSHGPGDYYHGNRIMHGTMRSKYYQLTSAVVKGANGDGTSVRLAALLNAPLESLISLFLYIPGFSAPPVEHVFRYRTHYCM